MPSSPAAAVRDGDPQSVLADGVPDRSTLGEESGAAPAPGGGTVPGGTLSASGTGSDAGRRSADYLLGYCSNSTASVCSPKRRSSPGLPSIPSADDCKRKAVAKQQPRRDSGSKKDLSSLAPTGASRRAVGQRIDLLSGPGDSGRADSSVRPAATQPSRFSVTRLRALCGVYQAIASELVAIPGRRVLRVLPLPATVSRGERQQGCAGGAVRGPARGGAAWTGFLRLVTAHVRQA
jgi:hypothetical protein